MAERFLVLFNLNAAVLKNTARGKRANSTIFLSQGAYLPKVTAFFAAGNQYLQATEKMPALKPNLFPHVKRLLEQQKLD